MSSRTARPETLHDRCDKIRAEEEQLREGGGKAGQERQHKLGRLVARERIARLLDRAAKFFQMRTTSGGSFEIIRSSPRPAFRNSPPSWAIASPAAPICRCCATRS